MVPATRLPGVNPGLLVGPMSVNAPGAPPASGACSTRYPETVPVDAVQPSWSWVGDGGVAWVTVRFVGAPGTALPGVPLTLLEYGPNPLAFHARTRNQ